MKYLLCAAVLGLAAQVTAQVPAVSTPTRAIPTNSSTSSGFEPWLAPGFGAFPVVSDSASAWPSPWSVGRRS